MLGCVCTSGKVFQAMEPVLLEHCTSTAGPLAWRGIIAAATVFAEAGFDTTPQNSSSSHSSYSAGAEAGKGPLGGTNSPTSSACNPTRTSSFLAALPSVMAFYSCHVDSAAASYVSQQSSQQLKGSTSQLESIIKLLKADARLMLPFIRALVSHCRQTVGLVSTSGGSHDQPSSQSCLVQASDKTQEGVVSITAEHARQDDRGLAGPVAGSAAKGGGATVVAALEALLALCEEQMLLAHLLELLPLLSEACSTLRYASVSIMQSDRAKICVAVLSEKFRNAVHV